MAGNSAPVTVGDTPVKLSSDPTDDRTGQTISIRPRDGTVVLGFDDQITFAGGGWTCGTGATDDSSALEGFKLEPGEPLWAVADTGVTVQVAVLEGGV